MCDATQVTQALDLVEDGEDSQPKEKVWARLITLNPQARPTIDLIGDQFTLGRQSCCNQQFKDLNISGKHCRITKEPCKNGSDIVFLEDLSTNGTFINGEKVGKGNRLLLSNGAQVALVLNKKKPQETIAYLYQECCEERSYEEGGPQKKYDIREALGAGNFAVVKLAINKATGARFAIKIIDKKKCFQQSSSRKDAIMGEVEILQKLKHPHIINIKETFDTDKSLYLVLELVECGELFTDLVKEGHYSEATTRDVFKQILDAVLYLHDQGIAHRDLKPENILLASTNPIVIKLSDFGLSRTIGEGSFMKTMCGTPQYLAPEIITSGGIDGYGKEVDMWSVGAILYILLCGYCPFEDGKSVSIFDQIKQGLVEFPEKEWSAISYGAKDIIKRLLTVNPSLRHTARQCMEHPWVKGEDMKEPVPEPVSASVSRPVPEPVLEREPEPEPDTEPEPKPEPMSFTINTPTKPSTPALSRNNTPPDATETTPDKNNSSTATTPEKHISQQSTPVNSKSSSSSIDDSPRTPPEIDESSLSSSQKFVATLAGLTAVAPLAPTTSTLFTTSITKSTSTTKLVDKRKRDDSDTDEDDGTSPKLHKSNELKKSSGGSKIQQQHSGGDAKSLKKSSSSSSIVKTEEDISDDVESGDEEDDVISKKKKNGSVVNQKSLSKTGSSLGMKKTTSSSARKRKMEVLSIKNHCQKLAAR